VFHRFFSQFTIQHPVLHRFFPGFGPKHGPNRHRISARIGERDAAIPKAGHEPARAELGPSHALARRKSARLGLAHFADEPEK
jgi:hypothetical protein